MTSSLGQGSSNDGKRVAALGYAERFGWPVFRCYPGTKEPMTRHGFKDATTDLDVIARWWSRTPGANVAVATGWPGPDVLDVDVKPEGTGWPAFERLRRAGLLAGAGRFGSTRNGGRHVFFAGTDQRCSALGKVHIDFRAAGGYVMAPPSLVPADDWAPHGTGRYELFWSRDSDARLDWEKCRALLAPPRPVRPNCPRPQLVDLNRLPRWLYDRLADADPPDRSAAFHSLVGGCAYAGLALAQTISILESWSPGVDKYGRRLPVEVERSWRKIAGGADL